MARVEHWKEECIGCAACTVVSEGWVMEGNISHVKGSTIDEHGHEILELDHPGSHQDAADVCPVKCIKVINGEKQVS